MNSSRKILATLPTYDRYECTSAGYELTLYADGRVAAESHSRWQGSTTGARWTTEPGYVDDLADPAAQLVAIAQMIDIGEIEIWRQWRQTRRGVTVR